MKETTLTYPDTPSTGHDDARNALPGAAGNFPFPLALLIAAWAAAIVILALAGVYDAAPDQPPLAVIASLGIPIAGFGFTAAFSRKFRAWLVNLDERPLILLHTWRMLGLGFVFLYFRDQLPALFALTAGLGDAIAAIGAFFLGVALYGGKTVSRTQKMAWNSFGLLDFAAAIAFGVVTRTMWNGGISSTAMGEFPMALIPGFAVPFFIITHLILYLKWLRERD